MPTMKIGRKFFFAGTLLACALVGTSPAWGQLHNRYPIVKLAEARKASESKMGPTGVIRGTIRSSDGTALYGILVKARGAGRTITTYVYTDEKGNYDFPPLPVGTYNLSVGTIWKQTAELTALGSTQNFNGVELGPGLVNQITGPRLLKVIPGSEAVKLKIGGACVQCHATTRLFQHAPPTPDGWDIIVKRMVEDHVPGSDWYGPSRNPDDPQHDFYTEKYSPENVKAITEFLAANVTPDTINDYAVKALELDRPKGEAARVVLTEWDLPQGIRNAGHVLPGENGDLWFIGGGNKVGRIDPITGKGEIWTAPGEKENAHFHDLDIDANGNLWTEAATSGNITKFDIHTHEFTHWSTLQSGKGFTYTSGALKGVTTPYPHTAAFDSAGNYWVTLFHGPDSGVVRLDTETGKLTSFPAPTPWSMSYGLDVDQHDNVWVVQQHGNKITRIEPSGKQTEYPLPLKSNIPRRIRTDSKGRLWFTGSGVPANISMLDPATGKVSVYEYGIPGGYAYWIRVDKHDKIWFNSGDPGNIIGRFDPETKKFVLFAYALTDTHSGQGFVDDSTDPVSVYQGVPGRPTILRLQVRP